MHRRPHDERDDMKVWLAEDEVDQFLDAVEDTTHRIAFGLGLRTAEIVQVTPADVVDGPAGTMLQVPDGKGGQYRETPVPPGLTTTIRTVEDVRPEPSDAPLVDVSTRTVRRWVDRYADELAESTGDDGWRDLSAPRLLPEDGVHDLTDEYPASELLGRVVDPTIYIRLVKRLPDRVVAGYICEYVDGKVVGNTL